MKVVFYLLEKVLIKTFKNQRQLDKYVAKHKGDIFSYVYNKWEVLC